MSRTRIVTLALAPLLLGGCSVLGDHGPGAGAPAASGNDVIAAYSPTEIVGRHSYVVVPGSRYDFTVSLPTDRLPVSTADEASVSSEPADGDAFVGVTWDRSVTPGYAALAMGVTDVSPQLAIVVDGRPVEVGPLSGDDAADWGAWVVVPEDAEIGVQVEYDGNTQLVDDAYDPFVHTPSKPSSLYFETAELSSVSCPENPRRSGLRIWSATCGAQVGSAVPYHSAVGWAEPGYAWVAAKVRVPEAWATYSRGDDYFAYDAAPSTTGKDGVALRLDGEQPVSVTPLEQGEDFDQDDGGWAALAVFKVADDANPDTLRVRRRLQLTARDDDAATQAGQPTTTTAVYRADLEVP